MSGTETEIKVAGRVMLGHTWDFADKDAPILVNANEQFVTERKDAFGRWVADLRCQDCAAQSHVTCKDGIAELVTIEHAPGCAWMTKVTEYAERHYGLSQNLQNGPRKPQTSARSLYRETGRPVVPGSFW